MRIKRKAFRSLEQTSYDALINFCFLPDYKLTLDEKKFAENNNIPNKMLCEAKKIIISKGKGAVRSLFKQRKMINRGNMALAFMKRNEM